MAYYYNLSEARTKLSRLIDRVAAGEEVLIGKSGKPMVRLVPFQSGDKVSRQPGIWRGKVEIFENFDDPLPNSLLGAFEGKDHALS